MKIFKQFNSMVQAITVLTVLKMMAKAQTTCNQGMGRIMYERLPNQQLQGFDDDVVRDTAPPFKVLEKCQDLCLRDRTAANNIVRACSSFDFQPGSRIASFSGNPEYEESTCYLTREQAAPEGIGQLMLVPNSIHFTEVCIMSKKPERECPMRRYVFERHPRKKLKLESGMFKEMPAANRSECEDRCLNEFSFVCRSATYDAAMRMCTLSRFTRRTHPESLEDDPNSDYLENTCLNAERRCDGLAVFIKEENRRLGGPFEADLFTNMTLEECQAMCIRAEKYFCRSIEFDETTKQCVISEEDSVSQRDDLGISSSPTNNFYDLVCLDNPHGNEYPDDENSLHLYITARGSEYPDNSVTSHLFGSNRRPDTAFQRYRNSRLSGEFHSEITGRSLSECLDECLRQTSFQCRSAVYSDRYRICRLSKFNQRDGMRIIYDADYDYYENLMHHMFATDGDGDTASAGRPNQVGPDTTRPTFPPGTGTNVADPYDRRRPSYGSDRYPDRYPSTYPDWYDLGHGGSTYDRYPSRYPPGPRYPGSRYPTGERYPPTYHYYPERYPFGDRYPPSGGRYPDGRYPPSSGGGRYPPSSNGGRYPPSSTGGRYPPSSNGGRYPPSSTGGRYPVYEERYPAPNYPPSASSGKYPIPPPVDRYPDRDYPPKYPDIGRPTYHDRLPPNDIDRYPPPARRPVYDYDDRYPPADRFGPDEDRYGGRYPDRFGGGRYPPPPPSGGTRWGFGRPVYDGPEYPGHRPGFEDNYPGPPLPPPQRPFVGGSRCDETDNFKQVGMHQRIRRQFIRRFMTVPSLMVCQRECAETRDFVCRSFNYRDPGTPSYDGDRDNCELSDRDSRDFELNNPSFFDTGGSYDFYERSSARNGFDSDCLDVSQECNEDGMTFTLKSPEGFVGRIYTYGFYDRCFFRGNGGTVNVLRISGPQGYPECGTQRYGDTMTNIVVVQFSDYVQTGKDKRYNLTCLFRGPGEAVVTSSYIGAGSGSPIPIEYLPAENTLSSKVRLLILYQGRETTTIAVGDPLTFRLEAQDGYNYVTDIFATNVIARDPYSGRSVQLIDRYGCPVDPYVFPELDRLRDGDTLEARFNAFKLPESNFLVFEATVRTCRDGCQPAYCTSNTGRSEPSYGRKRRSINETALDFEKIIDGSNNTLLNDTAINFITPINDTEDRNDFEVNFEKTEKNEFPELVREMIEVFESREQLQMEAQKSVAKRLPDEVCLTQGEYHGFISAVLILIFVLLGVTVFVSWAYRRYWIVMNKNITVDRLSPSINSNHSNHSGYQSTQRSTNMTSMTTIFGNSLQKPFKTSGLSRMCDFGRIEPLATPGVGAFEDPSEPIYTDPSLFERSRSLCSISVAQDGPRLRGTELP